MVMPVNHIFYHLINSFILQTEEETLLHVEVGGILQEDLSLASATDFKFIDLGMFQQDVLVRGGVSKFQPENRCPLPPSPTPPSERNIFAYLRKPIFSTRALFFLRHPPQYIGYSWAVY